MKKQRNMNASESCGISASLSSKNIIVEFSKSTLNSSDDIDTCKVCMENYGENLRPRSLNCGHSFCNECINKLAKRGRFECPKCKRSHTSFNSHDFPINYDLEEMISKFRENQLNSQRQRPSSPTMGKSSKMQRFIEEQIENAERLLQENDRRMSNVSKYRDLLLQKKSQHQELLPRIYEIASINEDIVKTLESEDARLQDTLEQASALKDQLTLSLGAFKKDQSGSTLDDVDKNHIALEHCNQMGQQMVTQVDTVSNSIKLMTATTAAFEAFNKEYEKEEEEEEEGESNPLGCFQLDSDKLEMIKGYHNLSLKELQRSLFDHCQVFAVQEHNGKIRCGEVSLHNDTINLHYLKDEEPPFSSYVIKHSKLLGSLTPGPVTAFLDLSWNGSIQGRVHILLESSTPLARQFQALCTGEQGPSYAHCRILEVAYKGDPINEALRCGDYEHNDGNGGAPVVEGLKLNDDQYKKPLVPGIVWATFDEDDGPRSSQFTITTGGEIDSEFLYRKVFGIVKDGFDVVKAAAKLDDIYSVKIADCGLVLTSG